MCIFCMIANGEIPSNKIYEDESVIAFLDINPTSYGHTLVVPKEHCDSFLDCPDETRNHVFEVASKLANKLEQTLHCDGINILSNVHEAAGQSVNHFHIDSIEGITSFRKAECAKLCFCLFSEIIAVYKKQNTTHRSIAKHAIGRETCRICFAGTSS